MYLAFCRFSIYDWKLNRFGPEFFEFSDHRSMIDDLLKY